MKHSCPNFARIHARLRAAKEEETYPYLQAGRTARAATTSTLVDSFSDVGCASHFAVIVIQYIKHGVYWFGCLFHVVLKNGEFMANCLLFLSCNLVHWHQHQPLCRSLSPVS